MPLGNVSAVGGAGSLTVTAEIFDPTTGTQAFADAFQLNGEATTTRFINDLGGIFVPTLTYDNTTGVITWEIASGLPAAAYVAASNTLDPALRGNKGEWIGTLFENATVT